MSEMKVCKFCKHGYVHFDKNGVVAYCYLKHGRYPEKKDPHDTCQNWEPDEDDEEDEEE